jgi:hypothetical protein
MVPFPKVQVTIKPCCITCGRTEPGNSGPSGSFGGMSLVEVIICPWTLAIVLILSSTLVFCTFSGKGNHLIY